MAERMNMMRIGAPENRGRAAFDPDRDIPESDWQRLSRNFVEQQSDRVQAAALQTFALARPRLTATPDEEEWLIEGISDGYGSANWEMFVNRAMLLKFVSPEKFAAYATVPLIQTTFESLQMDDTLDDIWEGQSPLNFLDYEAAVRILYPSHEIKMSKQRRDRAVEWVRNLGKGSTDVLGQPGVRAIAGWADLKIIDPKRTPKPSAEEWARMKTLLAKLKTHGNRAGFITTAARMKIIAADSVEVTDKGVRLMMPGTTEDDKGMIDAVPETLHL